MWEFFIAWCEEVVINRLFMKHSPTIISDGSLNPRDAAWDLISTWQFTLTWSFTLPLIKVNRSIWLSVLIWLWWGVRHPLAMPRPHCQLDPGTTKHAVHFGGRSGGHPAVNYKDSSSTRPWSSSSALPTIINFVCSQDHSATTLCIRIRHYVSGWQSSALIPVLCMIA